MVANICVFGTAKPGRVIGSVVPYENGRNIKDSYDARISYRNAVLVPQNVSPHYFFRTNNTLNQEKAGVVAEAGKDPSTVKAKQQQCVMGAKPVHGLPIDINSNPYYHQSQAKLEQLNERITIDAKLLQAQTQFGAVGAAAVAVAAHRNVQYGLT